MIRVIRLSFVIVLYALLGVSISCAQDDSSAPPPASQQQGRAGGWQNGPRPVFGKIAAIHDGSLELAGPDGQTVTVKFTSETNFLKDREPAKLSDFKVGDFVVVRGEKNADNSISARLINFRTPGTGGPGGPGGPNSGATGRPGGAMALGKLGQDYVAGEVKSLDPPKITVVRTDGVTQTFELTEDTSLHRGRDSITMADIKPGDHLMARGALQNNTFVPKGVNVMNAEQWQRMQQFISQSAAPHEPSAGAPPNNSAAPNNSEASAPKPQE